MTSLMSRAGGAVGPPLCSLQVEGELKAASTLLHTNWAAYKGHRRAPPGTTRRFCALRCSEFTGNSSAFSQACHSHHNGRRHLASAAEDRGGGISSVSEGRDVDEGVSRPIRHNRGEDRDDVAAEARRLEVNLKGPKTALQEFDVSKEERERVDTSAAKKGEKGAEGSGGPSALGGGLLLGALAVGTVVAMGAAGVVFKEQINEFLIYFQGLLETLGPSGYVLFVFVYAGLEILALPAIPLTLSAGLLFGQATGTVIVSVAGTLAATAAFLIARYLARDRILKFAEGNPKFTAIDKAIGKNSFKVVTLLRLSPLMPFSVGNYLYGLTSVKLAPYVLGSWLGMLPGTFAYVSAGNAGKVLLEAETGHQVGSTQLWSLGLGIAATVLATWYVTRLAKNAMEELEE